jgi:hypothetical protein
MTDSKSSRDYTLIEQEVIILNAVWELIGDMVNYEIFVKPNKTKDITLMPNSTTHKRLFNILLVDFLSTLNAASFGLDMPPPGCSASDKTYLHYLRRIINQPQLNSNGASLLSVPVEEFARWLEGECFIEDVWFPSIDVNTDLRVQRIDFLRICGNIGKHSFATMSRNTKDIASVLAKNGVAVDRDHRYLVIGEFYEWFHTNVLGYHISAIAEFLTNIRWGIYDYLRPEFIRSYTRNDEIRYHYKIPSEINRPLSKTMYWDLMNAVRSKPYMPRFEVTEFLKMS